MSPAALSSSSSTLPSLKRYLPSPVPSPTLHLGVELAIDAAVLGELAEALKPRQLEEFSADWPWRGVRERCETGVRTQVLVSDLPPFFTQLSSLLQSPKLSVFRI